MAPKVLVCDPIHQDGVNILRNAGLDVTEQFNLDAPSLRNAAPQFDALVVRGRTKVTGDVLEAGKKLKVVARAGVGLDNIDLEAANRLNVRIISTPAAPTTAVAELTIGLILSLLRSIPFADAEMKAGRWPKASLHGHEFKGKSLGVIGVGGRIGLEVARIAIQAFAARCIGYDIIDVSLKAKEIGFEVARSLEDLLSRSDIVTIHVGYSKQTHHLINANLISRMKPNALVINTSRGDLIDGRALLDALKSNRIAGAGLDVFHTEPPVEAWEIELVKMANARTVCTCHIGAQTNEAQLAESRLVAEQLVSILKE
jgi:D-3-phosphoglycerate dehydrogenase